MLEEKPWRADAVLRLFANMLISAVFLGSLGLQVVHLLNGTTKTSHALPILVTSGAFGAFAAALVLINRRWSKENFVREALRLLACIYAGFLLMWWSWLWHDDAVAPQYSTTDLILAVVFFQGAAIAWTFRFLREHGIGWAGAFGFRNRSVRALCFGALAGLVVFAAVRFLQAGTLKVMDHFRLNPEEQLSVQVLRQAGSTGEYVALGIVLVLIAPPAEELLFRGILYPAIKRRGFPRLALWGSSLLFAAVHLNLATFVPLTLLALILVWLYERTGNLLTSIAAHSLFNAFNFMLLQLQPWLEQNVKWLF